MTTNNKHDLIKGTTRIYQAAYHEGVTPTAYLRGCDTLVERSGTFDVNTGGVSYELYIMRGGNTLIGEMWRVEHDPLYKSQVELLGWSTEPVEQIHQLKALLTNVADKHRLDGKKHGQPDPLKVGAVDRLDGYQSTLMSDVPNKHRAELLFSRMMTGHLYNMRFYVDVWNVPHADGTYLLIDVYLAGYRSDGDPSPILVGRTLYEGKLWPDSIYHIAKAIIDGILND